MASDSAQIKQSLQPALEDPFVMIKLLKLKDRAEIETTRSVYMGLKFLAANLK